MTKQFEGRPVPSERFSWHPETRLFSAEESTLRNGPRGPGSSDFLFQQIYPDAADVGFPMRSAKTGESAWFHLTIEDRDGGGEIAGWNFEPTSEAVRKNPGLAGVRVLVVND